MKEDPILDYMGRPVLLKEEEEDDKDRCGKRKSVHRQGSECRVKVRRSGDGQGAGGDLGNGGGEEMEAAVNDAAREAELRAELEEVEEDCRMLRKEYLVLHISVILKDDIEKKKKKN